MVHYNVINMFELFFVFADVVHLNALTGKVPRGTIIDSTL
jgi:hypothetical protein